MEDNYMRRLLFLGVIFIFSFALFGCVVKDRIPRPLVVERTTPQENNLIDAVLILNYNKNKDEYNLKIEEGRSVLDLLKLASEKNNFSLKYQNYKGIGAFVEMINEIKNGQDNQYWQYTINGKYADKAADKWKLKNNDSVEWRFTKSQF